MEDGWFVWVVDSEGWIEWWIAGGVDGFGCFGLFGERTRGCGRSKPLRSQLLGEMGWIEASVVAGPCGRSQVARVEQNQLHFNGWRNGLAGVETGRLGRWVEADCASQLNQHPVSAVRDWRVRFPTSCGLLMSQAAGMG